MGVAYALEILYAQVKAHFDALFAIAPTHDVPIPPPQNKVNVVWGQTTPQKSNVGSIGRIAFVPCDDGGGVGSIESAEQWPELAEMLYTLHHDFRVYLFARDSTAIKSDAGNDHVIMMLLSQTVRAIYLATHNAVPVTSLVRLGKPRQLKGDAQHQWGREYVIGAMIKQPILDMGWDADFDSVDVAPADANITTTHEDTTDVTHMRQANP